MPLASRIEGYGSDGSKQRAAYCPAGHALRSVKAIQGTCDGCKRRVASGEWVMDCRRCNYYLCLTCHPQEIEEKGWLASIADMVTQEFQDLKELAEEVETHGPLAACSAVNPAHLTQQNQQGASVRETDEEITIVQDPRCNRRGNPEERQAEEEAEARRRARQEEREAKRREKEKPMEDLLDMGQNDLLDVTAEPVYSSAPVAAPPAPQAAGAQAGGVGPLGDLLDFGDKATPGLAIGGQGI